MSKLEQAIAYLETMEDDDEVEAGGADWERALGAAARREYEEFKLWKQRALNAEEQLRAKT